MATQNLGQVAGLIKSASAPTNQKLLWFDTNNNKIKYYDNGASAWKELLDGATASLDSQIEVAGIDDNVIGVNNGDTIAAGTDFQTVIERLLIKEVDPTYTDPTFTLSGSNPKNVEAGSNISPTLDPDFTQNDAGSLTEIRFYKNASLIHTQNDESNHTVTSYQIGDTNDIYNAELDHDQGPVKNTNLGNPSPSGQISAGTLTSNNVTYRGQRNLFYGTDTGTFTINSSNVRGLSNSSLNPQDGTQFTINIPAGTEHVVFAYPSSLPDVESVKYVEGLNAEVKGNFTKTLENIDGANGFTAVEYKVYKYTPDAAFNDDATYEVTI